MLVELILAACTEYGRPTFSSYLAADKCNELMNEWMNENVKTKTHISFKPMSLLSLLTNKDSYNTQIIQCVNDTVFRERFRVPGFGTGSGTLEPVPWNRFLRQITTLHRKCTARTTAESWNITHSLLIFFTRKFGNDASKDANAHHHLSISWLHSFFGSKKPVRFLSDFNLS